MKAVSGGIDQLKAFLRRGKQREQRVGILCHPSSLDLRGNHLEQIVEENAKLVKLFGPQHGIHGETQDNMIEWQDFVDKKNRPVYSLYGERRKPSEDSLSGIDLMIIDLFDVGARYYTFIYSMAYMLEACARMKIPVLICDRPNPLNGQIIEGPILNLEYQSFVGLYEIPISHGMSIAELALLFSEKMNPKPEIKILKVKNWKRKLSFESFQQRWLLPSPNMPSFQTCRLYPGMCLLEATSLSEGRGTTRPFELIGAPFIDWSDVEKLYLEQMKKLELRPVQFHRQGFIPNFHKFHGELCFGVLQIPPAKGFWAARHAVVLLWCLRKIYGDSWSWKSPPYEYEYEKLPIDILAGNTELRQCVDQGDSLKKLFSHWREDEKQFRKSRQKFLLY